ncbi:hypothetical protein NPIL_651451 [Nephila pilipes]|uniref:Uncharacterized protein n=1 Tax=Nephila pilipes TaxID=299642 RepID=A0A8X6NXF4_NEPPI|nr:hypothetical protein NPIL_651451 [Nephila pilipes]
MSQRPVCRMAKFQWEDRILDMPPREESGVKLIGWAKRNKKRKHIECSVHPPILEQANLDLIPNSRE